MAQLLRQVSTYLINKGLRLLILMFGCIFGMFLANCLVFCDTNYNFDNKDTRFAGFNVKICEVLIIIPALE